MMKLKHYLLSIITLFTLSVSSWAEINNNRPPFSLTLSQVEQWSPSSKWADKNNISRVDLQPRMLASYDEHSASLDGKVRVLIAPDGMNNFANYLNEQKKFNLYNFTHWSQIDVLNWFAGTANETVSLPSRPWVETAHKNGVKVIGTVYLSVAQYGGSVETVEKLLKKDNQGRFIFADKLITLAQYYGFDGWLINPETNLTLVKNAEGEVIKGKFEYENAARLGKKMQDFMLYLTKNAPSEMEIHWYDSMLLDGSVRWQNQLNEKNIPYFQQENQRFSDAMFINYWWNEDMINASNHLVKQVNRSPYDLYFGADLSPNRNAQRMFEQSNWLYMLFPGSGTKGLSSIALFGNDINYSFGGNEHTKAYSQFKKDKTDYRRFYQAERKLFAGLDGNLDKKDPDGQWPGIGQFVPAKTTLNTLPFRTSFNTGHGFMKAEQGELIAQEWHDISQQDILPTWQFAIIGDDALDIFYDFEQAFSGGNSLALRADKLIQLTTIPLYKTAFVLDNDAQLSVTFKNNATTSSLWIWLDTTENVRIKYPLISDNKQWETLSIDLSQYKGKVIDSIGLMIHGQTGSFSSNIGLVEIR
ncbi:hypothetical protein BI291_11410 [Thalassotalea sp. PP2-459]|nr:hypothetical protein BI291_11410 [Thalassotalea sp. PP2-459]